MRYSASEYDDTAERLEVEIQRHEAALGISIREWVTELVWNLPDHAYYIWGQAEDLTDGHFIEWLFPNARLGITFEEGPEDSVWFTVEYPKIFRSGALGSLPAQEILGLLSDLK